MHTYKHNYKSKYKTNKKQMKSLRIKVVVNNCLNTKKCNVYFYVKL